MYKNVACEHMAGVVQVKGAGQLFGQLKQAKYTLKLGTPKHLNQGKLYPRTERTQYSNLFLLILKKKSVKK